MQARKIIRQYKQDGRLITVYDAPKPKEKGKIKLKKSLPCTKAYKQLSDQRVADLVEAIEHWKWIG